MSRNTTTMELKKVAVWKRRQRKYSVPVLSEMTEQEIKEMLEEAERVAETERTYTAEEVRSYRRCENIMSNMQD